MKLFTKFDFFDGKISICQTKKTKTFLSRWTFTIRRFDSNRREKIYPRFTRLLFYWNEILFLEKILDEIQFE